MKESNKRNLYFNMVLGVIGIVLVFMGIFEFLKVVEDLKGLILIMAGMTMIVHYIYHLEGKVGVSNKTIWIKAAILIGIIFGIFYFY